MFRLIVCFVVSTTLLGCVSSEPSGVLVSSRTADRLAFAAATDSDTIELHFSSREESHGANTDRVRAFGGRIVVDRPDLAFASAIVPTASLKDVLSGFLVEGLSVEVRSDPAHLRRVLQTARPDDPETPNLPANAKGGEQVLFDAAPDVLNDMNAGEALGRASPYDGRGVVIAHVEATPDVLIDDLQTAIDITGDPTGKFLDILSLPDHRFGLGEIDDDLDPRWASLGSLARSRDTNLLVGGRRFTVPHNGVFRIGRATVPSRVLRQLTHVEGALPARNAPLILPLLWSEDRRVAWLDHDNDGDFSDETAVGLYSETQTFGVFGQDDPDTAERETVGYALQFDEFSDSLVLQFGMDSHATRVAAAAAGNSEQFPMANGAAPGAQLIIYDGARGSIRSFALAIIAAFEDPRSDIVLIEGAQPLNSDRSAAIGRPALPALIDRLIERHDKPGLITAHNAPGMGMVADISEASKALSVTAYQSPSASSKRALGVGRDDEALHWVGAEGPSANGAIKPDILAPANPIVATPRTRDALAVMNVPRDGITLPQGYAVGSGTSIATPVATGGVARLISRAKQQGLSFSGEGLRTAIRHSARHINAISSYKQGYGLIDLQKTWTLLSDAKSVRIDVQAPVVTALSPYLQTAHVGPGLYEREGWSLGDRQQRRIYLTRRTGPSDPIRTNLRWSGVDARAFSTPESVALPLNRRTPVDVTINAYRTGALSALLHLVDDNGGTIGAVGATVVVAREFVEGDEQFITESFIRERPGRYSMFVRVPQNTGALSVVVSDAKPSVIAISPLAEFMGLSADLRASESKKRAAIAYPQPGVWEIMIWERDNRDASEQTELPVQEDDERLNVSIQRTGSDSSAGVGTDGRWMKAMILDQRHQIFKITGGEAFTQDITVDEYVGALCLSTQIGEGAGVGLVTHLYHCPGENCYLWRKSHSLLAQERMWVDNPPAGRWTASVSPFGGVKNPVSGSMSITTLGQPDRLSENAMDKVWTAGPVEALYYISDDLKVLERPYRRPHNAPLQQAEAETDGWSYIPTGVEGC